jgi:hypothetical protein
MVNNSTVNKKNISEFIGAIENFNYGHIRYLYFNVGKNYRNSTNAKAGFPQKQSKMSLTSADEEVGRVLLN